MCVHIYDYFLQMNSFQINMILLLGQIFAYFQNFDALSNCFPEIFIAVYIFK